MTTCHSANEKKRRQVYRGEVYGQLPFDTRGMDDPVPTIDFSPAGGKDSAYSLEREDVDGEPDHIRCACEKKGIVTTSGQFSCKWCLTLRNTPERVQTQRFLILYRRHVLRSKSSYKKWTTSKQALTV